MFLYFPFFFTFTVLSFLSHASISIAGRSRLHRQSLQTHQHQPRNPSPANSPQNARSRNSIYKRSPASSDEGSVEIPLTQLQLLQVEIDSFQEWMGAWFESKNSTDSTPSMDLLQDEIQAYEGWMQAWLKAAISTSTAAEPTLPTSVAISGLASTSITSSSLSASRGSSTYQVSSPTSAIFSSSKSTIGTVGYFSSVSESPTATRSSYPTSSTTTLVSAGQFYQPSQSGSLPSAGVSTIQSLNKSPPEAQSSTTAASVSSAHIPASSSSAVSTSEYTGTSIKSSTSSYRFNAQASDNVAVYYGQSDATSQTSLEAICQDSNVDIVILAFLTDFFNADGYPTINFRAGCSSPTSEMSSKAPGLLDCPVLSSQMTVCQGLGKKVLLSLGGALADTSLSSDSQASQLATTLWNLFGAGSGEDPSLRPFGQARVDGFDIGKFAAPIEAGECITLTGIRQRRPQHSLLYHFHLLAPRRHEYRHLQTLLPLRRTPMSPPRCLHPPLLDANHGFCLGAILQQRRLQRWSSWLRRYFPSLER